MASTGPRPRAATSAKHRLHLPEEALEQLDSLIAAYDRTRAERQQPLPGADAEIAELKAKIGEKAVLWWTDLVQAEMCVLEATEDSALRSRLLGWRARMHEVVGDTRFAVYLSNAPNLSTDVPAPALRADLGECIRTVYYFYSAYGISARSRTRATVSAMRIAAYIIIGEGLLALVLAILAHLNQAWLPWLTWLKLPDSKLGALEYALAASCAAVFGSVVSVQRRVQDPSTDADPFYRYIQTTADWVGIAVVPPVFGAIFGLVMFALLISKLMLGTLITFTEQGVPSKGADIALLLLLGFLAGFAEQLIPDALNRLAARALSSVSTTTVATSDAGTGAGTVGTPPPPSKKPTVTGISPATAPPGTQITVMGTGFFGTNLSVKFGSTPGVAIKVNTDTQLSVTSPPGAGTVAVTVTTDAGTSDPSGAAKYTYTTS
jgi:hypothetical protein